MHVGTSLDRHAVSVNQLNHTHHHHTTTAPPPPHHHTTTTTPPHHHHTHHTHHQHTTNTPPPHHHHTTTTPQTPPPHHHHTITPPHTTHTTHTNHTHHHRACLPEECVRGFFWATTSGFIPTFSAFLGRQWIDVCVRSQRPRGFHAFSACRWTSDPYPEVDFVLSPGAGDLWTNCTHFPEVCGLASEVDSRPARSVMRQSVVTFGRISHIFLKYVDSLPRLILSSCSQCHAPVCGHFWTNFTHFPEVCGLALRLILVLLAVSCASLWSLLDEFHTFS